VNNIIIFGGSFDPPHNGHLNTALAVQKSFHFDHFIFLPCKQPILKDATLASAQQRVTLLELALADHPEFKIDTREINRESPSYMVTTLTDLRKELGNNTAITILIGLDAFLQLPQWHEWEKILTLANLLVIDRPGSNYKLPPILKNLLLTNEIFDKKRLLTQSCGAIYRYNAGQYPISSSWLRKEIKEGRTIKPYVPTRVFEFLQTNNIYTNLQDTNLG